MAPTYVLIVEDEQPVRRALVAWLRRLGFEAEAVESATQALAAIQRRVPTLVLSDYVMPFRDGLWLLQQVRSKWPSLPVVLCTGAMLPEHSIEEARQLGAVDFLAKPFTREALYQAILRATDEDRAVSRGARRA